MWIFKILNGHALYIYVIFFLFVIISLFQAPDKKRTVKAEAQRAAVQSLLHYLTHFKLSHAVRKNLLLIESMKEMAKGGKRNVKPEEFVRVYDILLQVSGEASLLLRLREREDGGERDLHITSHLSSFSTLLS